MYGLLTLAIQHELLIFGHFFEDDLLPYLLWSFSILWYFIDRGLLIYANTVKNKFQFFVNLINLRNGFYVRCGSMLAFYIRIA